ncbi:SDR family NAD(P)-dependent oxidoreductase [Streptacidiphilus sp. PB12-B1b]|uniref:SDR family NAD(P)-dependent oxidoreductase n=1 Tax=Streptacidiphilus sp. PB12-B1b TaxID=2705012 RepID=UPI0015F87B17|nr:SDR family NAD(P)-dependent oxidoreductase [Streptacidiphilus sp. PB12-B1b]QMU75063.1 SDR family NAD(P)-dependent oxidoreductase [Streptacidiphilus sp. PB12-B1b]
MGSTDPAGHADTLPPSPAEGGVPAGDGPPTDAELDAFARTVRRLRRLDPNHPLRLRAERTAESFVRDGRQARRRTRRQADAAADAVLVTATATGGTDRREDAPLTPPPTGTAVGELRRPRRCYVCKTTYRQVDGFYHQLCPGCAADNATRRALSTDLRGRQALLTGGRVKIGFQLALMLLRDGAELIVTSRFPHDAVRRFQAVPDSAQWLDRLRVVGIDLRDPRQVLGLCEQLRSEQQPLDILINNAAQTVRRPPEAYAPLTAAERAPLPPGVRQLVRHAPGFGLPAAPGTAPAPAPALTPVPVPALGTSTPSLPVPTLPREVDEAGLLPDTAPENSWSAQLGGLDPAEMLETHFVNALAPALLCDRLLPLLLASPHPSRYIVNVTAVEGRFAVRNKTGRHPHTNMAKAALNMLTRTSAADLAALGVHMCAVDTGWITDENPAPRKARIADRGFRTPLDIVDGAARVYDPIVRGEAGHPLAGVFLKDYQEAPW